MHTSTSNLNTGTKLARICETLGTISFKWSPAIATVYIMKNLVVGYDTVHNINEEYTRQHTYLQLLPLLKAEIFGCPGLVRIAGHKQSLLILQHCRGHTGQRLVVAPIVRAHTTADWYSVLADCLVSYPHRLWGSGSRDIGDAIGRVVVDTGIGGLVPWLAVEAAHCGCGVGVVSWDATAVCQ